MIEAGVKKKNIYVLELGKRYNLGKYIIEPVMAIHDVPNFGYKIEIVKENYNIFHITDTSSIEHIEAKNYNLYCLEANYLTDEELREKIQEQEEKGEFSYYNRVLNTHLSQLQALNWLNENKGTNSEYCFIHQHIEKEDKNVC